MAGLIDNLSALNNLSFDTLLGNLSAVSTAVAGVSTGLSAISAGGIRTSQGFSAPTGHASSEDQAQIANAQKNYNDAAAALTTEQTRMETLRQELQKNASEGMQRMKELGPAAMTSIVGEFDPQLRQIQAAGQSLSVQFDTPNKIRELEDKLTEAKVVLNSTIKHVAIVEQQQQDILRKQQEQEKATYANLASDTPERRMEMLQILSQSAYF